MYFTCKVSKVIHHNRQGKTHVLACGCHLQNGSCCTIEVETVIVRKRRKGGKNKGEKGRRKRRKKKKTTTERREREE